MLIYIVTCFVTVDIDPCYLLQEYLYGMQEKIIIKKYVFTCISLAYILYAPLKTSEKLEPVV